MNLKSLLPFWKRSEERSRAVKPETFIQAAPEFYSPPPTSGVTVNETTTLTVSAVFACVRNLAEDVAKLPFIVYRSIEPRGKERLPAHPLYRLLHDEPNPEMSAFDFRQAITASAVLWGGGYAEIERNNSGVPIALWPIEPWRVQTMRDRSGTLYYEVDGKPALNTLDALHIKGFGINGIVGMMMAKVGKESLGLTIAAQRFAAAFFGNGARVSGVLQHPKSLTPTAAKNLRDSFTAENSGANAHKPAVLEEGMTWAQVSSSNNEAQMIETRQFQIEDVARWFRMPPHKIQHLLRSTFSNIEHQGIEYVVDTLTPWLVRWEQETKRKLTLKAEPDVFAEHLVEGLLRGDIQSRYQALAIARQNGIINANEWRELENMNALPGEEGEAYFVNGAMMTVKNAMEAVPSGGSQPQPASEMNPQDTAGMRSAITEAHRGALLDAAQRAIRREVEVIRRKTKAKTGAKEAVSAFYADHQGYVRSSLQPATNAFLASLKAVGASIPAVDDCIRSISDGHVSESASKWAGILAEDITDDRIEAALTEWESTRATEIVNKIMEHSNG